MRLLPFVPLLAACGTGSVVSLGSAELEAPARLALPPTALGFPRRAVVPVANRGRAPTTVDVTVAPPFSAPASLTVPGGVDAELEVTFTPVAVGIARGELVVGGLEVQLSGEGVAALECPAAGICETSRFDPDTMACVVTPKADGTACEDLLECVEGGVCEAGRCRGRAARCDDGSACTTDACAVGLGCQYVAATCPAPANPCLAARCDPSSGCATAPVVDGTPCGAVSCEVANVCLAGECRAVTPPDGFTCSPATPCRGEGVCRSRRCVQPAERALSPAWTYTASTPDLRFEGISDGAGHWYWVECSPGAAPSTARCVARSWTAAGLERFATAVEGPGSLAGLEALRRGGALVTQLVAGDQFVFVTSATTLSAVSTSTGALRWTTALTAAPSTGARAITAIAEDGRGQLWALVRADSSDAPRSALVRLDALTGRVLSAQELPGVVRGPVLDGAGRLFATQKQLGRGIFPGGPGPWRAELNELVRWERDGRESLRVVLTTGAAPAPVLVTGDRLVLEDDSARSTLDGRELEAPANGRWGPGWWLGVAEPSGARFRLGLNLLDDLPETIALTRAAGGIRTVPTTWSASLASELHLTAGGDALVVTGGRRSSTPGAPTLPETRLRQLDVAGRERMSCALVDEAPLEPGGAEDLTALQLGGATAYTGRQLAVGVFCDCPSWQVEGLWTPPRVVVYELGPAAPALAASGWVSPRGTPQGGSRAR